MRERTCTSDGVGENERATAAAPSTHPCHRTMHLPPPMHPLPIPITPPSSSPPPQKFESLLEAAVDLDKVPDEYVICPRYSPDLEELAARKAEVEAEVRGGGGCE